ncbi:MAG: hypothetical protein V1668_04780 [Patescibacteria group bacterium]
MDQEGGQVLDKAPLEKTGMFYKRRWLIVIISIAILLIGSYFGVKNYSGIFGFYCKIKGQEYPGGMLLKCAKLATDAGKQCIQNSNCLSDICEPGFTWTYSNNVTINKEPSITKEGYVLGHCHRYIDGQESFSCIKSPVLRKDLKKAIQDRIIEQFIAF